MRIIGKPFRQDVQQIPQVSLRVQSVGLSGLQQGKDRGAGVGVGLGITEQPVLPTDDNWADGVLYLVVADLGLAVDEYAL